MIYLLCICLALFSHNVVAQNVNGYTPKVYVLGGGELKDATEVKQQAATDFYETYVPGYGQAKNPNAIFVTNDNDFAFGFGGLLYGAVHYDFNGVSENLDFFHQDINGSAKGRLIGDITPTWIYGRAIANTKALGRVSLVADMDFRGNNGSGNVPRLRAAYINFKNITIGRTRSVFTDVLVGVSNIDFNGPSSFVYNYAIGVRYDRKLYDNKLGLGIGLEVPSVAGTYNTSEIEFASEFKKIGQRTPDLPMYAEYFFDKDLSSHLRVSTLFRNMYAHNNAKAEDESIFGWGVNLSGSIKTTNWLRLYFNVVYGEGISPNLNGTALSDYDFAPKPCNRTELMALPTLGYQGTAQFFLSPSVNSSIGYSYVGINERLDYLPTEFKEGTFIFGNVFYSIGNFTTGIEYIYGNRWNMDNSTMDANRMSLVAMYSF